MGGGKCDASVPANPDQRSHFVSRAHATIQIRTCSKIKPAESRAPPSFLSSHDAQQHSEMLSSEWKNKCKSLWKRRQRHERRLVIARDLRESCRYAWRDCIDKIITTLSASSSSISCARP